MFFAFAESLPTSAILTMCNSLETATGAIEIIKLYVDDYDSCGDFDNYTGCKSSKNDDKGGE